MSTFTWHDNSNLDYGGIAFREIDWVSLNLRRVAATGRAVNDNALVWHRQRKRADAEALANFSLQDDAGSMESDI